MVVDISSLTSVSVNPSGVATVGAGIRLGPLYLELYHQGDWTLNAGSCPSVGIGGHALGGGFGFLSRRNGLLMDSIKEMRLVNATGEVLTVSATSNTDLFYALRGAGGGSYGVVTEFTFQAFKPPPVVTSCFYRWELKYLPDVLRVFADFPLTVSQDGSGVSLITRVVYDSVHLTGLVEGDIATQTTLFAPFLSKLPEPLGSRVSVESYIESQLRVSGIAGQNLTIQSLSLTGGYKAGDSRYTKTKSLFYPTALENSTIDLIVKWATNRPKGSTSNIIQMSRWGGAISDVPVNATAFIHRNVHTCMEFVTQWSADKDAQPGVPDCQPCLASMRELYADFLMDFQFKYGAVRAYQNYIDREMPNWQDAYYGSAITRLKQIKTATDPDNTFRFPQSIPLDQGEKEGKYFAQSLSITPLITQSH
jgi:hypothetical protein